MSVAELTVVDISAVEVRELLKSEDAPTIIDIRTDKEYQQSHIKGALLIDFFSEEFATQLDQLDKDAPYILHCKSGGRSTKALKTLEELGFTKVYHMNKGILDWLSLPQEH